MTIEETIKTRAMEDGQYAIAYSILQLTREVKRLGLNDACTSLGAIEVLATAINPEISSVVANLETLEVRG